MNNDSTRQKSARPSTASAALRLLKRKHPKLLRRTTSKPSLGRPTATRTNETTNPTTTTTTTAAVKPHQNHQANTQPRKKTVDDGARTATTNHPSSEPTTLRRLEGEDDEEFIALQRVECPHCTRKFAPDSANRHIEICANNKNKPKPPPKHDESYTDRFGIRRGGRGSLATSANVNDATSSTATAQRRPSSQQQQQRRRHNSMEGNDEGSTNNQGRRTHRSNQRRPSSSSMGSSTGSTADSSNKNHKRGDTKKNHKMRVRSNEQQQQDQEQQQQQQQEKGPVTESMERVARLSNKWGELMFLLRRPISNAEDMNATWQSAMNGVKFLQELNETASELGLQNGTLSRWLLPFDNQTSLADQAATAPPLGSSELDGLMSHAQRRRLVSEAVGLRSLIRVKIADNADLEQALASVQSLDKFMYRVKQTAGQMNVSSYALFQKL